VITDASGESIHKICKRKERITASRLRVKLAYVGNDSEMLDLMIIRRGGGCICG